MTPKMDKMVGASFECDVCKHPSVNGLHRASKMALLPAAKRSSIAPLFSLTLSTGWPKPLEALEDRCVWPVLIF